MQKILKKWMVPISILTINFLFKFDNNLIVHVNNNYAFSQLKENENSHSWKMEGTQEMNYSRHSRISFGEGRATTLGTGSCKIVIDGISNSTWGKWRQRRLTNPTEKHVTHSIISLFFLNHGYKQEHWIRIQIQWWWWWCDQKHNEYIDQQHNEYMLAQFQNRDTKWEAIDNGDAEWEALQVSKSLRAMMPRYGHGYRYEHGYRDRRDRRYETAILGVYVMGMDTVVLIFL